MISGQDASAATIRNVSSELNETDVALIDAPLPKYERFAPWIVLFALLAFVVCSWMKAFDFTNTSYEKWWEVAPTLFLILLTASFGIWFILAFTGSPVSRAKQRQCFRFAYSFTITTFIILMFPFLELWEPDISGPIGLVRGCVKSSGEQSQEPIAPRSVSCPSDQTNARTGDKSISGDRTANQPAEKTGDKSADTAVAKSAGQPVDKPAPPTDAYPWLLTIGGFVGNTNCNQGTEKHRCTGKPTDPYRHSVITNGLVVPFYVVFLAFIGGAISLSRRIPEYQKRSDEGYRPASDLPALAPLKPYEARESVVFQIMQLISAPFIAITAYWAIAPSTVPASIGLAFVSGFSSETILLLIRGVVDGIRPQTTMFAGEKKKTADKADTATESGKDADGAAPSVTVRLAVQADVPLDTDSLALTANAAAVTLSPDGFVELPLEIGRTHVLVATGRSNGEALRAEMTLTPSADDEGRALSINLVKQQQ